MKHCRLNLSCFLLRCLFELHLPLPKQKFAGKEQIEQPSDVKVKHHQFWTRSEKASGKSSIFKTQISKTLINIKHEADAILIPVLRWRNQLSPQTELWYLVAICTWNLQLWVVLMSKSLNESKTLVIFGRGRCMKCDILSRKLPFPKLQNIKRKRGVWRAWDSLWPTISAHCPRRGEGRGAQGSQGSAVCTRAHVGLGALVFSGGMGKLCHWKENI